MPSAAAFYRIIIFHYNGFPSKKNRDFNLSDMRLYLTN